MRRLRPSFAPARRSFTGSLLIASTLALGCGGARDYTEEQEQETASSGQGLSDTTPTTFKEGFANVLELADTAGKIHGGIGAVVAGVQFLNELAGAKSFETRMVEAIEAVRADIRDVVVKIAEGQQTVSAQLASQTVSRAAVASETARRFILDNKGAVFDPNTNPAAALADADSRAATVTFMNRSWYSKVSTVQGAPREFEWRLGLSHLIAAIGMRLNVLAALRPNFVSSGSDTAELVGYYDFIGAILAEADVRLIHCFNQPVVIRPGSDLNLPIRFCHNGQTGTQLGVGTIANPIPDAAVRARLMDEMGFDEVRAFRDRLHALIHRLPQNSATCAAEYETCWPSGVKTARYGDEVGFFTRTTNGIFNCGNETFGDPRVGALKSCAVGDLIWNPCSSEYENCYFDGVKAIRYGAAGNHVQKLALGGIECGNLEFGDPAVGFIKSCEYADPVWTPCGAEGGFCNHSGPSFVRYGHGDRWVYWRSGGSFPCNNSHGDPAVGQVKVCEVASLP